jgi:hypothetical protein
MKKINFLIVCLVTIFLMAGAGFVLAEDKVDVTGTWELDVKTDSGQTGAPIFILKQDGENLAGTYRGYFGEAPVKGTIKGQDLEMKYGREGEQIVYKGKSDGKKMSGTIDFAGQDKGTFTGQKK